jgi:hypothetical protein
MARFGRETWSLLLPDGWRAWHDDECATLVADDGIGVLQISAAFKDCDVLDSDLRDFAAEHLGTGAIKPTRAGDFVGFETAFRDGDRLCRLWYLRNRRQMLFVTYNSGMESRSVEDAALQDILASLAASGEDVGGRRVSEVPAERLGRVLATEVNAAAEATLMSTAEKIEKEALEKGRAQGRDEGRNEGRDEGQRDLLVRMLTARFGALPASVVQRVRAGNTTELERWAEAILFVKTLDEVFGPR